MASGDGHLFPLEDLPTRTEEAWKREPAQPKNPLDAAREFGGWTLNKLEVLELYFKMYRRVAGGGTYLDAFAGEGQASIRGDLREGSPVLALRSGAFASLHFVELETELHDRLDRYLRDQFSEKQLRRCRLHPGDCNKLIPELIADGELDVEKPCFAFLDQDSTQLGWEAVRSLAEMKSFDAETRRCKVELWVLFNTHQVLQRMWPADRRKYPVNPFAGKLDFVMGERSAWEDLYREGAPVTGLTHRYAERLASELGYRWVHPQAINDPESGRTQYHMIHASDHPAALDLMRWAKRASRRDMAEALALPFE